MQKTSFLQGSFLHFPVRYIPKLEVFCIFCSLSKEYSTKNSYLRLQDFFKNLRLLTFCPYNSSTVVDFKWWLLKTPQPPDRQVLISTPKALLSNIWGDTVSLNIVIVITLTSRLARLKPPMFANCATCGSPSITLLYHNTQLGTSLGRLFICLKPIKYEFL